MKTFLKSDIARNFLIGFALTTAAIVATQDGGHLDPIAPQAVAATAR